MESIIQKIEQGIDWYHKGYMSREDVITYIVATMVVDEESRKVIDYYTGYPGILANYFEPLGVAKI